MMNNANNINDIRILLVDGNAAVLQELKLELSETYKTIACATGKEALSKFAEFRPNVVVVDVEISDVSFVDLLNTCREKDKNIIRIVISQDFGKLYEIIDVINQAEAHYYFRKPINYAELRRVIEAKTIDYHVVKAMMASDAESQAAYNKMKTILDRVREADKLREQSLIQLEKSRIMEVESVDKIKDSREEVNRSKKRLAEMEKLVADLEKKGKQLEEVKNHDIENLRKERDEVKKTVGTLQEDLEVAKKEKTKIHEEIDILLQSTKASTVTVSSNFKNLDRVRKNNKDSILCVDDEEEIISLLKRFFKNKYNVYTATGGEEALKLLSENKDICLVVSDQQMPKMLGTELAAKIQDMYPMLPIFLLTGHADLDVAIKSLNEGHLLKFFKKPIDMDFLEKEIDAAIAKFDVETSEREILEGGKAVVVDQIKDLTARFQRQQYEHKTIQEESAKLKAKEAQRQKELEALRHETSELKVAVSKKMAAMIAETEKELAAKRLEVDNMLTVEREKNKDALAQMKQEFEKDKAVRLQEIAQMEKDLANKQIEAEKVLEVQREKNKEALELMRKEIEQEKFAKMKEIEAMRVAFEAEKKKIEAELDVSGARERVKKELAEMDAKLTVEKEKIKAEIEKVMKSVDNIRAEIEARLRAEIEHKKKAAEVEIEKMKSTITRDLDKLKIESQKKEQELTERLTQAVRQSGERNDEIKLIKRRADEYEKELEKLKSSKAELESQIEQVKAENDFVMQSREALEAELASLKSAS